MPANSGHRHRFCGLSCQKVTGSPQMAASFRQRRCNIRTVAFQIRPDAPMLGQRLHVLKQEQVKVSVHPSRLRQPGDQVDHVNGNRG